MLSLKHPVYGRRPRPDSEFLGSDSTQLYGGEIRAVVDESHGPTLRTPPAPSRAGA